MSDSTTYITITAESLETLATAVEAKKQDGYVVSGAPYVAITGYAQDMILASALSPIDFPEAVVDITSAYIGSRTKESGSPVYYVGDKVEPEEYGATLTLKSGATRSLFQDDFYVSPREISSTDDTTVKVIYKWEKGFEDEVDIAPKAVELTSIVVQDMPRKTTYVVGQTFTGVDGLEVTALYNNNSLKRLPASAYIVNTEDVNTSAAGTCDVIVSYTEGTITKTVTFNIKVVVNTPVALEVRGNAKLQYVGKSLDASGLTFKATMLDGSVKDVTNVTSDAPETLTDIGTKKVTFSYTENNVTASVAKYFNVTTMKPVALTMTGEFATQYINTAVNLNGLAFKAVYDNGDVAVIPTSSIVVTPSTWGSTVGIQTVVFTYAASGVTLTLTKSVDVQEAQQGSSYLKYSSDIPFKFAPVEYAEVGDEGVVIDPTGTLSNLYINCAAEPEDVEEVFGRLSYEEKEGSSVYYAYAYGAEFPLPLGLTISKEDSSYYNVTFIGYSTEVDDFTTVKFLRYNRTSSEWEESNDFGSSWEPITSEIYEITSGTSDKGVAERSGETIGSQNSELTKIFSFNISFGEGGYEPAGADTPRWDGELEYHIGSEPSENTEWIPFPAEGEACDWIEVGGSRSGTVINPTGTFTEVYLNCDATADEVAAAFGAIYDNEWIGDEWPEEYFNSYIAFCGVLDLSDSEPENTIQIQRNAVPSGKYDYIFSLYGDNSAERYLFTPEAIPGLVSDKGWYALNGEGVYVPVSGIQTFRSDAPGEGQDDVRYGRNGYRVGIKNDKLTKIFSFNEPFEEGIEPNLYIRGTGNSTIVGEEDLVTFQTKAIGSSSPQISLSGKLMALFNYKNLENAHLPEGGYGVQGLFQYDENLTDASELILPSTLAKPYEWDDGEGHTLFTGCLEGLFYGCTSLTTAPSVLPAPELTGNCYAGMFRECASLTTPPELPATILARGCYMDMFSDCTSLTTTPALPATTLAEECYGGMFWACEALTSAPVLPATEMALGSYNSMFYGCTSLTTASSLPATTLAQGCYQNMFGSCTSLTTTPELSVETLADDCYAYMFQGCTSLTTIPELPATTLAGSCYYQMFKDCNIKLSQTETPECPTEYHIPSEGTGTTATSALYQMFNGTAFEEVPGWMSNDGTPVLTGGSWTGFVGFGSTPQGPNYLKYSSTTPFKFAPVEGYEGSNPSPVQGNTPRWDNRMQYHVGSEPSGDADWTDFPKTGACDWITAVKGEDDKFNVYIRGESNTTIISADAGVSFLTRAMEDGDKPDVSISGNLMALFDYEDPESAELPNNKYGVQWLFKYDENLTDASGLVLPSTLAESWETWGCLGGMFYGCTSLTAAPALPAQELADDCYVLMFWNCTSLTSAPALPATTLASGCYSSMFEDCTSLTTAPALPVTTLASGCYQGMFRGCTSLATLPELPAITLAANCYEGMFEGCTSVKLSETPTEEYTTPYRIPKEGTGTEASDALTDMFTGTGGDFEETPDINTTYYTSNTVVPPAPPSSKLPVGGTIFYEDTTAGGRYKLYDENLAETSVLSEAKYYEVTTPGTKDRYYVYDSTTGVVDSMPWGYSGITTGATTDAIGSGKTNTNAILAIEDTSGYSSNSIFAYLKNTQNAGSGVAGCKDWFVGSKAEQDELIASSLGDFYTDKDLWSSVESSGQFAYRWGSEFQSWYYKSKYSNFSVVFMRSF